MSLPFKTLSNQALLDSLIEYYDRYKRAAREVWDEKEYITCNLVLRGIHDELQRRGIKPKGKLEIEREFRI